MRQIPLFIVTILALSIAPIAQADVQQFAFALAPVIWTNQDTNQTHVNLTAILYNTGASPASEVTVTGMTFNLTPVEHFIPTYGARFRNSATFFTGQSASEENPEQWYYNFSVAYSALPLRGMVGMARAVWTDGVTSHVHQESLWISPRDLLDGTFIITVTSTQAPQTVYPQEGSYVTQTEFADFKTNATFVNLTAGNVTLQSALQVETAMDDYIPFLIWGTLFIVFLYFRAWPPAMACMMNLGASLFPTPLWSLPASVMLFLLFTALHVIVTRGIFTKETH